MPNTITFLGRRQTDTISSFTVDLEFHPKGLADEAGVSIYLDEKRHIDFAIIGDDQTVDGKRLRLRSFSNNENLTLPQDVIVPLPGDQEADTAVRLEVRAETTTHYMFLAGQVSGDESEDTNTTVVGYSSASLVSGCYTGTVVGVYGTTNGEATTASTSVAYVSRWRYYGKGQYVDHDVVV